MGPRAGLDRCGKSHPTGIRSPECPARSLSLYRLSYPGTLAEIKLSESPELRLDFCLWGWANSEFYERKVDTADELLARILDVAASTKKR